MIAEAFDLIDSLAKLDGAAPMNRHEGAWERKLDDQWTIAVNGHPAPVRWNGVEIPSYHCFVEFNGWPAGLFSPYGGTIAAGAIANEAALIAVLQAEIDKARAAHGVWR